MRPGAKVTVKVAHSLPYETLTLELQSTQAASGTDQTAAFVTAAIPNLKGLLLQTSVNLQALGALQADPNFKATNADSPGVRKFKDDSAKVAADILPLFLDMQLFGSNAIVVYGQLNEVLGTIPPALLQPEKSASQSQKPASQSQNALPRRLPDSAVETSFPRPWRTEEYDSWRSLMRCELAAVECPTKDQPKVKGLLSDGAKLATALGACPPQPQMQLLSCRIAQLQLDLAGLSISDQERLSDTVARLNAQSAILNADLATVTALNKDLLTYFSNINFAEPIKPHETLGAILDPRDEPHGINTNLRKTLGRQTVYAINSVNEVAASVASVPTTAQKKSIATITVLYADPRFEVSSGALFSTLPNRSFANQTIVTQNPGGVPTQGNVVIAQTITRPSVVLFAGANYRLGHDFAWLFDQRRGAFYLTGVVGLNVSNTTAEFGVGPSLSWRSLMFSPLVHFGHDVRLTQGEQVGQVWCNATAANGSIPKCSGNPPAPTSEKYWKAAFGFGISVRIPAVFGGGSSAH
jgi:hypothetical protein